MNINFEGVINGQKFSDLEGFYDALKKLDEKDTKNISLSYQTSWSNEKEEEESKGISKIFKSKKKYNPANLYLSVDLDELHGTYKDEDILKKWLEEQDDNLIKLEKYLKDLDSSQLEECASIIAEMEERLDTLNERNYTKSSQLESLIKSKEKELGELRTSYEICGNARKALSSAFNYCKTVKEMIS